MPAFFVKVKILMSEAEELKPHKLNIYKLNTEQPLSGIEPEMASPAYELESEELSKAFKYRLFVQRNAPSSPKWIDLLNPILDAEKPAIISKSSSFIFFLESEGNKFAICGGYGYSKITKEMIDDDFGIHIGKRIIDPDEILSLTQGAMRGPARRVHRALVGYKPQLDLENYNRLLKAIEGKTVDPSLSVRVSCRKSLSFTSKTDFKGLEAIFKKINALYIQPARLDLPENYSLIEDEATKQVLNSLLIKDFNDFLVGTVPNDRFYLELEELYDQFMCQTYSIKVLSAYEDLPWLSPESLKNVLLQKNVKKIRGVQHFKQIKLRGLDEHGTAVVPDEPLWNMLVYEASYDSSVYLFYHLKWYRILDGFKKRVDEIISRLEVKKRYLPPWRNGMGEPEYNKAASAQKGWPVLDRDLIVSDSKAKIEVCDLFNTSEREYIHIKKVWGSKSSYLFAQGLVSAEVYSQSEDFRNKCKLKWPRLFDGHPERNPKVIYGIADEQAAFDDFPNNLSFFAKLNLVEVSDRLRSLGYHVSLAPIEITQ